jgi:hypothetical protein
MPLSVALATLVLSTISTVSAQQPPPQSLKIVVLEGEGAVNIIQQKTAVRPLIEVRDRNNVPVAGASVTFTIGGGGQGAAFAGGAQTLTVTTNAAGQAAASGLNAISSGAFQIQVQAAYQGQIATAAISQTNFATAAAAAQAGAGAGGAGGTGGGASGAAGGAAGGGGGISATTIGIVAAAVGGGALAATQVVGKSGDEDSFDGYNGPFNGQIAESSVFTNPSGSSSTCTFTYTLSGTLTLELRQNGTGSANLQGTITMLSATSTCIFDGTPRGLSLLREDTPVTGGPSAPSFTRTLTDMLQAMTWRFTGSLAGNNINGTLSLDVAPVPNANPQYNGSTTMQVTLIGPRP